LQPGERVITEGADRLRDGSRVILPGDQPQAGRRREGASGAASSPLPEGSPAQAPSSSAPRFARSASAPSTPSTAIAGAASAAGPTPEQRQRMLDAVKDDPEQLERRKRFLAAIDSGDPQAVERWQQMQQRRQQGGGQ
jgi:multidrug efflux system membrane fusion protein